MSISADISRIKSNVASALAAIADKGVTVPEGSTSDALAGLIASIEAGGSSSSVRIEQGSVTFADTVSSYQFVDESPDIFIAYVETDTDPVYSSSAFVWALIQDTRLWNYYGNNVKTNFVFGYNVGSRKYFTPYKCGATKIGAHQSVNFNGVLGATTYKWYAIYGVTAT